MSKKQVEDTLFVALHLYLDETALRPVKAYKKEITENIVARILHRLTQAEAERDVLRERVRELEKDRACTCSKCLGLPDEGEEER